MRRGPVTQRIPSLAAEARESERLLKPTTKTLTMSRAVIDALLEADHDRAQSETLRAAVKVACEDDFGTCDVCGVADASVDTDAQRKVDWICSGCETRRNDAFGVPSAWDNAFSASHSDKEE